MRLPLFSFLLASCFLLLHLSGSAQHKKLTVGLQYKPIVPSKYFNSDSETFVEGDVIFNFEQRMGYAAGMIIRRDFSQRFSFETGINYLRRNYRIGISDEGNAFTEDYPFKIIGYELPALALVYVRLDEQVFMNTAFGFACDIYPSDVGIYNKHINHSSYRKNWIKASLLANLGFEYRTTKSGILYLGTSLHRPFSYTYLSEVIYEYDTTYEKMRTELSGNYITIDLRYFFHEEKEKR